MRYYWVLIYHYHQTMRHIASQHKWRNLYFLLSCDHLWSLSEVLKKNTYDLTLYQNHLLFKKKTKICIFQIIFFISSDVYKLSCLFVTVKCLVVMVTVFSAWLCLPVQFFFSSSLHICFSFNSSISRNACKNTTGTNLMKLLFILMVHRGIPMIKVPQVDFFHASLKYTVAQMHVRLHTTAINWLKLPWNEVTSLTTYM